MYVGGHRRRAKAAAVDNRENAHKHTLTRSHTLARLERARHTSITASETRLPLHVPVGSTRELLTTMGWARVVTTTRRRPRRRVIIIIIIINV